MHQLDVKKCCSKFSLRTSVAALHKGAPGQMTWLEDPPPWLRPAYCFALVIVWRENRSVTISDSFICFILTVKQSAALAACVLRATTKKGVNYFEGKSAPPEKILATPLTPGDLAWGFSDLFLARDIFTFLSRLLVFLSSEYLGSIDVHHLRHWENDSRAYILIMLIIDYCWRSRTCRLAAHYRSHVDWLIDNVVLGASTRSLYLGVSTPTQPGHPSVGKCD